MYHVPCQSNFLLVPALEASAMLRLKTSGYSSVKVTVPEPETWKKTVPIRV